VTDTIGSWDAHASKKGPAGSHHGPNWSILIDKIDFTDWSEVLPMFGSGAIVSFW